MKDYKIICEEVRVSLVELKDFERIKYNRLLTFDRIQIII